MEFNCLKFEQRGKIGILFINRPKALNALNEEVFFELRQLLNQLTEKKDLRALIITGEGKAFVAGADIKSFQENTPDQSYEFAELGKQVFNQIENLKVPVVAAINGFALGGGLELALACDIRIASEKAMLGLPEVNLGLIPGFDGTQRLPRLIGKGNANYIMMLGEAISSQKAYELGIVQNVVSQDLILDAALELSEKIVGKSPVALSLVKEVVQKGMEMKRKDAGKLESKEFGALFHEDQQERQEGINAFIEKRKPKW